MPFENRYLRITALVLLLMAACDRASEAPANPHDTKYEKVQIDGRDAGDCIRDSTTGLTWELKSDDPGLRDWRNTYSWFRPDESHGELDYRGLENGGECAGSKCDTWHYVRAVNAISLCGYNDWHLPTKDELFSISDPTRAASPPTVNLQALPYTQPDEYWSANDYSFQYDSAWAWNFRYGHDRVDWKKTPKFLRLVRGDAVDLERVKE